jgi:hypothetical protein
MNYYAKIKLSSGLHKAWIDYNRLSGLFCGVWFHRHNMVYETDFPLTTPDLEALKNRPEIEIVALGMPIPMLERAMTEAKVREDLQEYAPPPRYYAPPPTLIVPRPPPPAPPEPPRYVPPPPPPGQAHQPRPRGRPPKGGYKVQ